MKASHKTQTPSHTSGHVQSENANANALTVIPTEYLPPANSIDERIERVGAYYHSGRRAAAQLVVYNVLAGIELIGIREQIVHGEWMKWCAQHLPEGMSYRSATYFVGLAEALIPKIASVANFDFKRLQIGNGELSDKEIKPFAEAVQEVTNGKAYTDLLREYGLMAQPIHQKDRPNQRKQSPEEILADRKANAVMFIDNLIAPLGEFCADHQLHADLETPKLKEFQDALLSAGRQLRDLLKARGKSKPAKKKGRK